MNSSTSGRAREFLLRTRLGRMILLATFLAVVCLAVPYGCSKRGSGAREPVQPAETLGRTSGIPASPAGFDDTLTLGQKYDALITRWGTDLSSTKGELGLARRDLEALRNALAEERSSRAAEKKEMSDVFRRLEQGMSRDLGGRREPEPVRGPAEPSAPLQPHALRTIALSEKMARPGKPARSVHVPAASGGLATLLNGVFAPTTGEPSPVRLRFDAALVGPNRSRLGLRDAYLIGKAQGEANSSRVVIQIDSLSYVSPDGRPVETKVLGYVVGTDGLEGVPGSYEWRATELLPLALASGAVSTGTDALALGETTRSITPLGGAIDALSGDSLKYAGYRSLAGGTGKLSELFVERMKEIRPAVSTRPGQEVTVVFIEGVTLEGLGVEEIDHAKDNDPFRGLDIHR